MKKIFSIFIFSLMSFAVIAQSSGSDFKNFRFGGTALPSIYWYKPDNLKKFAKDGSVFKFGFLINGEYSFSQNFAIGFGLGLGSAGGKIAFTDTARYFFSDDAIIKLSDTSGLKGKYESYKLNNRNYSASYFLIPISLKMRTNEIGYLRYFFEPRFNIGIRKKVLANDDVYSYKTKQTSTQSDLDITKDMSLFRFSATLSAGGEYYLSGSTAIVFAIGYDYGLSNVVKNSSDFLLRSNFSALPQKNTQHGVILSVGFLF